MFFYKTGPFAAYSLPKNDDLAEIQKYVDRKVEVVSQKDLGLILPNILTTTFLLFLNTYSLLGKSMGPLRQIFTANCFCAK